MAFRQYTLKAYFDDIDRLAENIENNFPESVNDDDSLQEVLNSYFDEQGNDQPVFLTEKARSDLLKVILYQRAGGKGYMQDIQRDAKTIYPNSSQGRQKFEQSTPQKTDLSGVDTKDGKRKRSTVKVKKQNYTFIGETKGKIVKARREYVIMKGKKKAIYRDRKGHFVKLRR